MKKIYEKPLIMFESFTLSTNIAGDCEKKTNTPNSGTCAWTYTDEFGDSYVVFTNQVSACGTNKEDQVYNGICYHIPEGDNLFNS